jgi:hypothetical protein
MKSLDGEGIEINSGNLNIDIKEIHTSSFALKVLNENTICSLNFNNIYSANIIDNENISVIYIKYAKLFISGNTINFGEYDYQNYNNLHGILMEGGEIIGELKEINGGIGYSIYGIRNNILNLKIYGKMSDIHWEKGYFNLECSKLISSQSGSGIEIMDIDNEFKFKCYKFIGDIIDNGDYVKILCNNYISINSSLIFNSKKSNGYHYYKFHNISIKEISILQTHQGNITIKSNNLKLTENINICSTHNIDVNIFSENIELKKLYTNDLYQGKLNCIIKNNGIFENILINSYKFLNISLLNLESKKLIINPTNNLTTISIKNFCNIHEILYLGGCKSNNATFDFYANHLHFNKFNNSDNNIDFFIGFGINYHDKISTHLNGIMNIHIDNFINFKKDLFIYIHSSGYNNSNNPELYIKGNIWNSILTLNAYENGKIIMNIKKLEDNQKIPLINFENGNDNINNDIKDENYKKGKIIIKDMIIINNYNNELNKIPLLYFHNTTFNILMIKCIMINKNIGKYNASGSLISSNGKNGKFISYDCISNLPIDENILNNESSYNWKIDNELIYFI